MKHLKTYGINYLACLVLIAYALYFLTEGNIWRALVWFLVALAVLVPVVKRRK